MSCIVAEQPYFNWEHFNMFNITETISHLKYCRIILAVKWPNWGA